MKKYEQFRRNGVDSNSVVIFYKQVLPLSRNVVYMWREFNFRPFICLCKKKFCKSHELLKLALGKFSDFYSTAEKWSRKNSHEIDSKSKRSENVPVFYVWKCSLMFFNKSRISLGKIKRERDTLTSTEKKSNFRRAHENPRGMETAAQECYK